MKKYLKDVACLMMTGFITGSGILLTAIGIKTTTHIVKQI